MTAPDTKSVVIAEGIRCVDEDGQVHADGVTATVPAALADEWIRNQWATEAKGAK